MVSQNRILIVEDNETSALLLQSILTDITDYQIDIIQDGNEAMEYIDKIVPKFIFLDVMLPDIDGFSILKEIKNREQFNDIPVFIVSAKDRVEDLKTAKQLGADDYILKPIEIDDFYNKIGEYFEK